jgi:hypothetical protein
MNPHTIYNAWFKFNNPDGEIININGKMMARPQNCSSYHDIEINDRTFNKIKNCIYQRSQKKSIIWQCNCGICTNYLLGQLSLQLEKNELDEKDLDEKDDDKLLNEIIDKTLYEVSINALKSVQNPMDNMSITFGKHKNKSFKTVFDTDKEYCIWCIESVAIERTKSGKIMNIFVEYVKDKFKKL